VPGLFLGSDAQSLRIFEAMQKTRFAIIGCGKIATRHAAEAARLGQLVAVCDIVPERADALAAQYGAKAFYNITDLLAYAGNIDLLAVCTPNGMHAEHSIAALAKGLHVLCEKPLCLSVEDAEKMMQAAHKHGRRLFVVKSTRYNPALAALKQKLDEAAFGKCYSFQLNCFWNRPAAYYAGSWKGGLALDGGTLFTQFSHYIDALLWLLGDIREVRGYRKNMAHEGVIEFEDSGVAAVEMENGMLGGINWSVNSFQMNMEVSLSLIAEKGSIRIGGEYMNRIDHQLLEGEPFRVPEYGQANDYGFYKGSMSNHDKIYENLLIALQDARHPFANAADGLRTVAAIERIYRSVTA
jgi:UDP-N-acetyl-2-amino-2-deoxyglucuronate dehydrogenase